MSSDTPSSAPAWRDSRALRVLGMGAALPGPPLSTAELIELVERFGVRIASRVAALADKLNIHSRHVCRDFADAREAPRPGNTNPELAGTAVRAALKDAQLEVDDLAYLIGHTVTPARLLPPNVSLVAEQLGFTGPFMELRQGCTGFANALVIAHGLLGVAGGKAVAIVGSETGSVFFDPRLAGTQKGQLVSLAQMGDGAAAVIVGPDDATSGARISNVFFGHVGNGRKPAFTALSGGSESSFVEGGQLEFTHHWLEVHRGSGELLRHGADTAGSLGTVVTDVDHVVPPQPNGRMDELLSSALGVEPARVFVNADIVGNTGSAAIWLALAQLREGLKPDASCLVLGAEVSKYMFGGFSYVHA